MQSFNNKVFVIKHFVLGTGLTTLQILFLPFPEVFESSGMCSCMDFPRQSKPALFLIVELA